ncbi:MAG: ATP-binding protein [Gemmatimonadaceae bacterium]
MNSPVALRLPLFLDVRRLLRWVFVGRLALSAAIYLAAILVWKDAESSSTLIASLVITVAMIFTAGSAAYSEFYQRPLTSAFLAVQALFDLALATTIVHLTGAGASQFAALYILVIALSSLFLSATGGILIAVLGCFLYFADTIIRNEAPMAAGAGLWLQLTVFAVVAVSSAYIASRLRESRHMREELAAELVKVRLQATDILRNIRAGIITVDAGGQLLYANPTASALLGISLEEHVGRPAFTAIEPVSPALARALERASREGVRTTRAEGTVLTNGRRFPIGLNTTFTSNGNGHGGDGGSATAIFQDISDQKRLDTLHMRAERLEAVAELSASLAHEIKNPLASIRSAVEQLGRSPRATSDEQTLASLIVRESDRLARLLTEFLDFARVRVAKVVQVDIRAVAKGAARLAESHPDVPEGLTVECVVPEALLVVEGDEDLLHRALFNLTLNAVQASPPGSRVRVEVSAIRPDETPAGVAFESGGAMVKVTDQGSGIPTEIRDRLFDPFFTTKPGGSGLGLSVVHRAIEAHRGFVFVDSDDTGTRVTVLLPQRHTDSGGTT